jgi:serine/threonine-protein kinase
MGTVYKGIDVMLEREVAIKALRPEFTSQPQLAERFRSEAITLAKLNHPNIATLHTFFRQGEEYFMVMEFVRGETLDSLLRKHGAMPPDHAISLFRQALEGIGHAHTLGIIHRDIKPANMMLTPSGQLKVMDFGIARVLGTSRMTRQGNIVGTIEYMSPEAIQGNDVDSRSDIYSLGILLYEMVTGRVPFVADTEFKTMMAHIQEAPPPPRTFMPSLPVQIEHTIMRSLAKMPTARFQTVVDFSQALGQGAPAMRPQPVQVAAVPPPTRLGDSPVTAPPVPPARVPTDPSASVPTAGGQMKETRLGGPAQFGQPYQQPAPPPYAPVPYPAQQQGPLLSRLNWMHYAGAGVLLLLLLGVPLAFLSFMSKKPAPVPSPVAPAPVQSGTPAVAEQPVPAPVPAPQSPTIAQPTPAPGQSGAAVSIPSDNPQAIGQKDEDKRQGGSRRGGSNTSQREKDLAKRRAEAKRLLDQ